MSDQHGHQHASSSGTHAVNTGSTTLPSDEPEAGPSRIRRSSAASGPTYPQRPASPANTLPNTSTTVSTGSTFDHPSTASDDGIDGNTRSPPRPSTPYLDLATYPTQNLLRLLASLLQQIASANDQLRPEMQEDTDPTASGVGAPVEEHTGTGEDAQNSSSTTASASASAGEPNRRTFNPSTVAPTLHPSPTTALFSQTATSTPGPTPTPPATLRKTSISPTTGRAETLFTASKTSLSHQSSLLSFHARHIPSISIEAYLLRILKYCPTTNEVFLGLLVYFDRMSRLGTAGGLGGLMKGGKGFAIDSYNVHRLVIAGVTVASKFFSDVFYTNSRYAKVGGLPPHELNQLELQFLLLNDFRLVIPADEMQRYGNRLLGYWENRESEAESDSAPGPSEESSTPNANGVGAPTEDQVKAATAMVSASGSANDTSPKTPNVDAAQHRTSNHNSSGDKDERPSAPRQMTHPNRMDGGGFTKPVPAHRRSSFDGSSNPAAAQGTTPSAIPTA